MLRGLLMRERALVSLFRRGQVDRNRGMAASALERHAAIVFIEQEVLAGGEEEGAEAAALAIGDREVFFLDQAGEEGLRQVLRFLDRMAASPDEREDRIPVQRAETRQRHLPLGGPAPARLEHEGPLRRRKAAGARLHGWQKV